MSGQRHGGVGGGEDQRRAEPVEEQFQPGSRVGRRERAVHGAGAQTGQQRHHGVGPAGQHGGDRAARGHTGGPHAPREGGDLCVEIAVGDPAGPEQQCGQ